MPPNDPVDIPEQPIPRARGVDDSCFSAGGPMSETPGIPLGDEVWTPLKILTWAVPYLRAKGVESARLDVECLLANVLGCDRLRVYLQYDRPLTMDERGRLRDFIARRAKREPLAYLLGNKEFYGLSFAVDRSVLIPRPESEMLVEEARKVLETFPKEDRRVLDLGTGSGCLAVALTSVVPGCRAWAVDLSPETLKIARENAHQHGVEDRIQFREGSWWKALSEDDPAAFQVILSNPPYISKSEREDLAPEIREYEPATALFGGEDGLEAYRALRVGLKNRLTPGGRVLMEINSNLDGKICGLFEGWEKREVIKDLQGLPRVIILQGPPLLDSQSSCV